MMWAIKAYEHAEIYFNVSASFKSKFFKINLRAPLFN